MGSSLFHQFDAQPQHKTGGIMSCGGKLYQTIQSRQGAFRRISGVSRPLGYKVPL
jgi:hypothetical protein